MKIMTLNTHSLEEVDYEEKLAAFIEGIRKEQPQVIALQEVNQTRTAAPAAADGLELSGYVPCCLGEDCEAVVIREDNHAYRAALALAKQGCPYSWTWVSAKIGYGKYDEGLAILSTYPVLDTRQFFITKSHDHENWKTRKILGLRLLTDQGAGQFYSVHMGWWKDEEEPFKEQWERICSGLWSDAGAVTWLMGDFNSPSGIPDEGYGLVRASGWWDAYELAEEKDSGITVDHSIDGWKDKEQKTGMRIDYIWSDKRVSVKRSRIVFDGKHYPVVSDHFGVLTEPVMQNRLHGNEG